MNDVDRSPRKLIASTHNFARRRSQALCVGVFSSRFGQLFSSQGSSTGEEDTKWWEQSFYLKNTDWKETWGHGVAFNAKELKRVQALGGGKNGLISGHAYGVLAVERLRFSGCVGVSGRYIMFSPPTPIAMVLCHLPHNYLLHPQSAFFVPRIFYFTCYTILSPDCESPSTPLSRCVFRDVCHTCTLEDVQ